MTELPIVPSEAGAPTPAASSYREADGQRDLVVRNVSKRFGRFRALEDVSLTVRQGEFLTLLGPSGSGKTTLLMAIAGFLTADSGCLRLGQRDITALAPEKRDFGMVFQGYALFPHLTVFENVAFPLRVRGVGTAEVEERVLSSLELVQLSDRRERLPRELSGGQQQRVALARAMVFSPHLLLLDEPLSALDKKLRAEMQDELKRLHRTVGLTFIYVTHDQDEALSMSDRVVVMREGRIVQEGAPEDLYRRPLTRFVAGFVGRSNLFEGVVEGVEDGGFVLRAGAHRVRQASSTPPARGTSVAIGVRPEAIHVVGKRETPENALAGTVRDRSYLGSVLDLQIDVDGLPPIHVEIPAGARGNAFERGAPVTIGWPSTAGVTLLDG